MSFNRWRLGLVAGIILIGGLGTLGGANAQLVSDVGRLALFSVVILVAGGMWLRERALTQPLRRLAKANNWTFTPSAPSLANAWQTDPFPRGNKRKATSVMRGTVRGHGFTAFNLTITVSTGRDRLTTYYSVVALDLPVPFPAVQVRSTLGGVEQAIGLERIGFESDAFNQHFRVTCADRKLASDVLTPRSIELLVANRPVSVRIGGGRVFAWATGRLDPHEVTAWSSTLVGLVDLVPSFVWTDHGGSAPVEAPRSDPWLHALGSYPAPPAPTTPTNAPDLTIAPGSTSLDVTPFPLQENS